MVTPATRLGRRGHAMSHVTAPCMNLRTAPCYAGPAEGGAEGTLGKPLLVIFGEDDRRWRSSSAADYLTVPGAEVEVLPGLGHSPVLEDPPRTAAPFLAFAAAHAVRTG
ncbi:hypothetical protein GCM10027187_61470 [Streptosporangium sandarakinum]